MTPLSILIKATIVAALGLLAAWTTRRNRASVRHALLAAAFAVLLLVPVASIFEPPILIALPGQAQKIVPAVKGAIHGAPAIAAVPAHELTPPAKSISLSAVLLAVWIGGAVLFLVPVVTGIWQVRKLRQTALPWREGQALVEGVEVLLHESLAGPIACGVWRPAIVFSSDAPTWNAEDLQRAMVHELEHVRRFDWLSQCVARAICALYWFHPLVWIARDRLALEAERSCDDAVLRSSEPTAYADQLVELAERLSAAARTPLLTMANRADLAVRVGAVLDNRQSRGRAGMHSIVLACVAAVALVLTISPLRVGAAQSAASVQTGAVFTVSAPMVVVDVTVKNPAGTPINGLGIADFELTDEGVPQTISLFESVPSMSYYILGYRPTNLTADGSFHKIGVHFNGGREAKLDFRSGYFTQLPRPSTASNAPTPKSFDLSIAPPVLISKAEPEYSDEARKAKQQGTVVLSVEIDESGAVTNVAVVKSLGLGLDERAVEAVQQWRFRPGLKGGRPVAVQTSVEVNFRLL